MASGSRDRLDSMATRLSAGLSVWAAASTIGIGVVTALYGEVRSWPIVSQAFFFLGAALFLLWVTANVYLGIRRWQIRRAVAGVAGGGGSLPGSFTGVLFDGPVSGVVAGNVTTIGGHLPRMPEVEPGSVPSTRDELQRLLMEFTQLHSDLCDIAEGWHLTATDAADEYVEKLRTAVARYRRECGPRVLYLCRDAWARGYVDPKINYEHLRPVNEIGFEELIEGIGAIRERIGRAVADTSPTDQNPQR